MEDTLKEFYSVGQFAKRAGVTIRTLRYYDKIGLLKPCGYNNLGYRLYSKEDFGRLQKILTLKFIGLSLEEIGDIMKYDINDKDFKKSLVIQKEIMGEKVQHMLTVIKAIDETLQMVEKEDTLNWDKFVNVIKLINLDKKWIEQYKNSSNLRARINLHESFSINKEGWMPWFFKQLSLPNNINILELGCGDGSLWAKNLDKIPNGWNITLTDFSEGMLEDAKRNLGKCSNRFHFSVVDAENITYENESFDVVIANHMLYHLNDIDKALHEINRVLKKDGYFFASTVGKNHMKEMRDIIGLVDESILELEGFNLTKKFQLNNGIKILTPYFNEIYMKRYEDSLKVKRITPLIDYIFSMPGNVQERFNEYKFKKLEKTLEEIIQKKGYIYITKDTGFFTGRKNNY
ncbi:MerR family transcriptional regulator [Clostridium lundense]|uniref:MerR family transcriptional regulator n=1 Tax=Clostridium lundense TaxID=319475 RepID=UPI000483DFAB|nr:methyltransferase domain-containing protein [Clostridium lundense]